MQSFSRNQEQMREYFQKTMGGIFPFDAFSNMGKQNLAMMEQAMKMFAPFASQTGEAEPAQEAESAAPASSEINDLRRRLDELEREISGMGKGTPKK
jgi:polyhydroxyalkanoate synthesis regulator protein